MIELRPHHGLCIGQFIGKGYNETFVQNMSKMVSYLESHEEETIRLVCHTDIICGSCPHNEDGKCRSGQKVLNYDKACLTLCGLQDNQELSYQTYKRLVRENIYRTGKLKEVCSNCSWISLCLKYAGCRSYE